MNKLELFITEMCPFCIRVLDVIEQEFPSGVIPIVDLNTARDKAEFHYNKTGRYTVPCLYINEEPLFESMDIIDYLLNNKETIINSK